MENELEKITLDDMKMVDEFVRRTFYSEEPLVLANGLQFWNSADNLQHQLVPRGLSVKAHRCGTLVGIAINDCEFKERRIYNSLAEDTKFLSISNRVFFRVRRHSGSPLALSSSRRNFWRWNLRPKRRNRLRESTSPMFDIRAAGLADTRELHDFFVRTLYAEEPLLRANSQNSQIPPWIEGLCAAVVPQGRSVVAVVRQSASDHRRAMQELALEQQPAEEQQPKGEQQLSFEHQPTVEQPSIEHQPPIEQQP
ncbi:unnamed protein product, partial [Nesidiocoris tenuis]